MLGQSSAPHRTAEGQSVVLALETLRNVQLVGRRRVVRAPAAASAISYFTALRGATGSFSIFFFPSVHEPDL